MRVLNFKFGIIFMIIHLISGNKNEAHFSIFKNKGIVVANIDYTEKIKVNSSKKFECALKCLQKQDCNMAYSIEDNCFIFFKCQIKKYFFNEKNSKIYQKKKLCLRDYSNLRGNIFFKDNQQLIRVD